MYALTGLLFYGIYLVIIIRITGCKLSDLMKLFIKRPKYGLIWIAFAWLMACIIEKVQKIFLG